MIMPNLMTHAASCFAWDFASGIVDASDLGFTAGKLPFAQVYDDAADLGFYIYSAKSDRRLLFTLLTELRDGEGELSGWRFAHYARAERVPMFTVTILND